MSSIETSEREAVEPPAQCDRPPAGWWCSRGAGHAGPCAVRPFVALAATPSPSVPVAAAHSLCLVGPFGDESAAYEVQDMQGNTLYTFDINGRASAHSPRARVAVDRQPIASLCIGDADDSELTPEQRAVCPQCGSDPHKMDCTGATAERLPNPGSPIASAMMDSVLAEYEYPANPKNAARAGYEAARRLQAVPAQQGGEAVIWSERDQRVHDMTERLEALAAAQKPLPPDFAKVLSESLWDLYATDASPPVDHQAQGVLDPNESDAATLWAEIFRLQAAVKGPDGFASWQQAATAERVRRVAAEKALASQPATPADKQADTLRWIMPIELPENETGVMHDAVMQVLYEGVSRTETNALWQAYRRALTATPAAPLAMLTDAASDVLAERRRQIERKGYELDHDDEHVNDEIAALACYYAMPPAARDWPAEETGYGATFGSAIVPEDWNTSTGDRRTELVKAGALILAEIERLDRAAKHGRVPGEGA